MWSAHRWNCRVAIRFSDWSEMSVFSLDLLREYFYIPTEINNENISPFGKYLLLVPTTSIKNHVFLFFFGKANYPGWKFEYVCVLLSQNPTKWRQNITCSPPKNHRKLQLGHGTRESQERRSFLASAEEERSEAVAMESLLRGLQTAAPWVFTKEMKMMWIGKKKLLWNIYVYL